MARRRVTLERRFNASVEELWELWTTKEGFESWWGPDGFRTEVKALDVRVGGETVYAMIATGKDQVDFLKEAGMPLVSEDRLTLTEVLPHRRLAYTHLIDFFPGVEPYRAGMEVEFEALAEGARMVVTLDVMHDERTTQMALTGMAMQLDRLEKRLAG